MPRTGAIRAGHFRIVKIKLKRSLYEKNDLIRCCATNVCFC